MNGRTNEQAHKRCSKRTVSVNLHQKSLQDQKCNNNNKKERKKHSLTYETYEISRGNTEKNAVTSRLELTRQHSKVFKLCVHEHICEEDRRAASLATHILAHRLHFFFFTRSMSFSLSLCVCVSRSSLHYTTGDVPSGFSAFLQVNDRHSKNAEANANRKKNPNEYMKKEQSICT